MKNQISKRAISYSLVAVMLVSQSTMAELPAWLRKEAPITVPNTHPCARELQQELNQIRIMEETKKIIDGDSVLRVTAGTAASAIVAQDALSALRSRDWFSAGVAAVTAAVSVAKTVSEGKKDIKVHYTIADSIQERKTNLKYVLDNPSICNESVRKAYLTNYMSETIDKNKSFLGVLDAAISKMEGTITPVQNAVGLGIGVILAGATYYALQNKTHWLALTALGLGSVVGLGVGIVGYGADYLHNIPTLNDLKAQKAGAETINNQLQEQLKQLQQAQ